MKQDANRTFDVGLSSNLDNSLMNSGTSENKEDNALERKLTMQQRSGTDHGFADRFADHAN